MKWRFYLKGRKFTVRSDHRALSFFRTQPVLNDMLIGWADILLEYDFDVEYVPGKTNVIPDALSRLDFPLPERSSQELETSGRPGILRRLRNDLGGSAEEIQAYAKTVLGKEMVEENRQHEVLEKAHALGHFGAQKMVYAILQEDQWFPDMRAKAEKHVAGCLDCLRYNIQRRGYQPQTRLKGAYPFEVCSMDLIDLQSLTSEEGFNYVFLYVDACTRFVILEPLRTQEKREVATTLWKIFSRFGPPKRLLSDNGSHFVNDVLAELTNVLGVNHNLVSPYHAASNGLAESHVRVMSITLKKMLGGDHSRWRAALPMIEMSLNQNVSSVHGSIPTSLVFNRPTVPWRDYRQTAKDLVPMSVEDVLDGQRHLEEIYSMMGTKIDKALDTRTVVSKPPKKTFKYKVGDFVYWRNHRKLKKTDPDWVGPYTVEYVNDRGGAFLLDALGKSASSFPEHPHNLKRVRNPTMASEERFEISNILDEKKEGNDVYYLTTFKLGDSMWLQPSQFDNSSLIAEFHESRRIILETEKNGKGEKLRMIPAKLKRHQQRVDFYYNLKNGSSLSSFRVSDPSTVAPKPKRSREATIQMPKPSVTTEALTEGICEVCNKSGVTLYKKQGKMVCGGKCYHDSVLPSEGPRKRKKRENRDG